MAGSWQHMTTPRGKLLNNERFCGMIENLGDAYEAAEECHGMIWLLARQLAVIRNETGTTDPTRDQVLSVIRRAEANWKDGQEIGGVQRSR